MARVRFDDVVYRIVEDPARPRRRPPRRWALGAAGALIAAGAVAAGASALSRHPDSGVPSWHMHYGAAGLPPAAKRSGSTRTGADGADVARAEAFKRNLLYGRILREAAATR